MNPFELLPYEEQQRQIYSHTFISKATNKRTRIYQPVTFIPIGRNRFRLVHPFDPALQANIKSMGKPNFDWNNKFWSILNDQRTAFTVRFLEKGSPSPYEWFKQPLPSDLSLPRANLFKPQIDMVLHAYIKRYVEWACEMGLGKTLAAIQLLELIQPVGDVFWIGPKSAIAAVKWEFEKWQAAVKPIFMTYDRLVKYMQSIQRDTPAPQVVIFDESQKIKNMDSQRSEQSYALTCAVREEWGFDGAVVCMTGTPAPKTPIDWYSQIEILCPGFLKESNANALRRRLAVVKKEQYENGFSAEKVLTWLDDENKCAQCGQLKNDLDHVVDHGFVPSKNEVALFRKRLEPIVLVRYLKDAVDLPEIRYELIKLPVDSEMKRYSSMIRARAKSVISAITMLRELSDGFLYEPKEHGTKQCPVCSGKGQELAYRSMSEDEALAVECPACGGLDPECEVCHGDGFIRKLLTPQAAGEEYMRECRKCKGTGVVPKIIREAKQIRTPKDEALRALLDNNEEQGRIVIYGGFTGTIDRIVHLCLHNGWDVFRCDGRGMHCFKADGSIWNYGEPLKAFQDPKSDSQQLAFVGHPEAGGIGLTLTRAHSTVFYSNCYKADARIQSEFRIHRLGMDTNRGATIYDLIHLPQDEAVLKVLKTNRDLQDLTLREFEQVVETIEEAKDTPWLLKPIV